MARSRERFVKSRPVTASSTALPPGTKSGLFVRLSPPLLPLRVAMGRPPDGLSAHYIRNRKLARAWSTGGGRARVAKCHGRRAEGPRTALLLTLRSPARRRIPGMASAAGSKREGMNRAVERCVDSNGGGTGDADESAHHDVGEDAVAARASETRRA